MSARRRIVAAVGAVGVVAMLAACTPADPEPTASPMPYTAPAIVGDTVSASPLEADEWVVAARAGMLGFVLASNAADFSIDPFVSAVTPEAATTWFEHWSSRSVGTDRPPLTWPGPQVVLPLAVDLMDGDGDRATVRFCNGSDYWQAEDASALADGVEASAVLVRTEAGIRLESTTSSAIPCDATGAAIGRFDPAPEPLGVLTEADVVPPPNAG